MGLKKQQEEEEMILIKKKKKKVHVFKEIQTRSTNSIVISKATPSLINVSFKVKKKRSYEITKYD